MSTFTKWNTLPSELRDHSLSYNYPKELGKYAQISALCNEQIQKCNTTAPKYLYVMQLKGGNNGIMIHAKYPSEHDFYLIFVAASESNYKLVKSSTGYIDWHERFEYEKILEGNARRTAFEYLEKLLKYTKTTIIENIKIDCEEWPSEELNKIPAILKVTDWTVRGYPVMRDRFMTFMYETTNVKKLRLERSGWPTMMKMPSQFFNSNFFKQLEYVDIDVKSTMLDDSFLASNAKCLKINCNTINGTAFNKKIQNWYDTQVDLSFDISSRNCQNYRIEVILQNLPFEQTYPCFFKIRRQDGKVGHLTNHGDGLKFETRPRT